MTRLSNLILLAAIAAMAVLAGCVVTDPIKVPDQVPVEVPVACVKPEDVPTRPELRTEVDLYAMDRYRRTLASQSDLEKLRGVDGAPGYVQKLEAIVDGCSRLPGQAEPAGSGLKIRPPP